ncbi:uncharacterized protein LOC119321119 [Triticum dicoccoides]|uniref:uncharacterized protein LOC119321119 n=1 Tax=Triticum dicoccoides TaxID=85692 RepID=UPI0018912564|nr:uncharacterized protein LOC119321119 [Triticum dicoccoides]
MDFLGNYSLAFGSCSGKERKEELKTTERATLLEVAKFIAELRADEEITENSASAMAASTTNSKKAAKGGQSPSESSARGDHMSCLEDCSDKDHQKKLKTDMATLLQVSKFTEDLRTDGEIKENNASALVGTRTNSERATEDIPKAEGWQSISGSSTSTSFIERVPRGMHKPPIKNVYTRRDRKQKESTEGSTLFADISSNSAHEGIQKPPIKIVFERRSDPKQKGSTGGQLASKELNKGMNPGSSSHATRIATLTCNMLDSKFLLEKQHEKEMKMAETALLGKGPESTEEFGDGENKDNNVRTSTADYTRNKTAAKTLGAEGAQSIKGSSACMIRVTQTKGVDVAATVLEGARFDGKQLVSKMTTRLTQFYEEFNTYNEIHDSFVEMGLRENLLKGIYAYGLAMPSAIHRRGIVPFCKGLDVIQQSLSGTTVTLACGVLQRLDYGSTECQALVLVPTRDLAQETEKVIGALGQWLGVKAHACLGGTSIREENEESKFQKLCDLFDTMAVTQNIIFVNARRKVKPLTEKIRGRGYTVSASHGGMDQHSRDAAVQDLQSGSSRVLVTTDLHGADALQVPVVINYDLPAQPVQYLRNVRRSGHPGGIGVAISFVARADERVLSGIQRFCNTQMAELPSNVADLL